MHLMALSRDGWACHVVAHSHGGNVLLQALYQSEKENKHGSWVSALPLLNCILLGTPVLEIDSVRARDESGQEVAVRLLNLFVVVAVFASAFWAADRAFLSKLFAIFRGWWLALGGGLAFMTGVLYFHALLKEVAGMGIVLTESDKYQDDFLTISSPHDEAWLLYDNLSRLRHSERNNDQTSRSWADWLRALARAVAANDKASFPARNRIWSHISTALTIVTLALVLASDGTALGARASVTMISVALLAWMFLFFPYEMVAGSSMVVRAVAAVAVIVRSLRSSLFASWLRKNWIETTRAMAFGYQGHPNPSFRVTRIVPEIECQHIDLPEAVLARVRSRRNRHLGDTWSDLYALLSNPGEGPLTVDRLLETVERLPNLIHAAYYQESECVDWIAQWIARTKPEDRLTI